MPRLRCTLIIQQHARITMLTPNAIEQTLRLENYAAMMIAPPETDNGIIEFARSIIDSPVLVRIRLAPGEPSFNCSQNVRRAIKQCGGRLVKGWRIWLLPGKLLQAEAHSVWEAPNGVVADVTPTGDGDTESLFFEDPNMQESPGDDFIYSPQKNICGHPLVDEYIRVVRAANEWADKQLHGILALPNIPEQTRAVELNLQLLALKIAPDNEAKG